MNARVLLVDDETNMAKMQAKILQRKGYEVDTAGNGREALQKLERTNFDVVITDLKMPVMDGMQLLREMNIKEHGYAVIVVTGHGTIESAVEAMQRGAADYLTKPCNPDELLLKVDKLLETKRLREEVARLRREVRAYKKFGELIGQSSAMHHIYSMIGAVGANKSTVLITGESGTGKELVARTIHQKSPWAERPFIAINCGAMSETLLDSQLFGHRRGAFTGAIADHNGVFQSADGGTLLLDEIGEIPLALQVKFLRAIQEKEVTPLGSSRPVKVDVRLIAASNRNLEEEVKKGTFRDDLFYRLSVVPIHLPPLRERRDDIPFLIEHFIATFSKEYNVEPKRLAPAALDKLVAYPWPGNIRELQNVIERVFALSQSTEITLADLPVSIVGFEEKLPNFQEFSELPTLEAMERSLIATALRKSHGNKNEAARLLAIDRQRLYRKIDKYGLEASLREAEAEHGLVSAF
ncbi:MAG: sigma-54-dependent Fis family transcriptional regulator [Deltaproteobacteria bacterium]|nr:sigma-54-dependent Fis family transcriptional regulator [Deltaproteobacteria bacterium]